MRAHTLLTTATLIVIGSLLASCTSPSTSGPPQDPPRDEVTTLDDIRITEYEGQDLSSLDEFRENSIAGPQYVDIDTYRLDVEGLVAEPAAFTYSEIASDLPSYKKVVTLDCVEGWSVTILWEGVLFRDILGQVDVDPAANTVILRAVDGYSTSFPIEYFYERDILLAYSMNGVELPPERGFPLQLVAEDKWGYKWIKWVDVIELSDDVDFQGYWESRGYSDTGDRDRSFYDGD